MDFACPGYYVTGDEEGIISIFGALSWNTSGMLQTYQLLNCDDHANFLKRNKKNPAAYRPDITHQVSRCSAVSSFLLQLKHQAAGHCATHSSPVSSSPATEYCFAQTDDHASD